MSVPATAAAAARTLAAETLRSRTAADSAVTSETFALPTHTRCVLSDVR